MIVDIHNQIGQRKGVIFLVEDLLKSIDKEAVDRCVVFSFPENIDNAYVRESVKKHEDRLIGFATINPWMSDAEEELKRCLEEYGFKGLWLHPVRHGYVMDDHFLLDPLLEICSTEGVPVMGYGVASISSIPNHFEDLALTFPDLTLIIAHMGYMYETNSAMSVAAGCRNVYLETAGVFVRQIQKAVGEVGASKIVFGSNAPYDDLSFSLEKIRLSVTEEEERELILGGNAVRLMGLG